MRPDLRPTLKTLDATLEEIRTDYEEGIIKAVEPSETVSEELADKLNQNYRENGLSLIDAARANIKEGLKDDK